ncbi:MAG: methyl-accepting chemotaxis protein [Firmicutes bacterium]|nr:methyl-accepting chemotaxis protein [Bacillota bacterium]
MSWFTNLKISKKLIISFITVAFLAGIVGVVGIVNIKKINDNYSDLFINYGIASGDIGELGIIYHDSRSAIRDILLEKGNDRSKYIAKLKENDKKIAQLMQKVEKSMQTEEGRRNFVILQDNIAKYNNARDRVVSMAVAHKEEQAYTLFWAEAAAPAAEIAQAIDQLFDLKATGGTKRSDEYSATTNTTIIVMILVVVVAMLVAISLGLFIARLISKPIGQLVEGANNIANGDLNVTIEVTTNDEIGSLAATFRKMADQINDVMVTIAAASEQVASGSKQVSDSSMSLSQGATEQASSIEQLTASIEEIAAQTRQNADSADQANQLAETAQENAAQGNSQMQEMQKAMVEINESSSNISKIIKVIDEIAFQTNILALNAAVEAARAGQHGKGFAVVAEEVRNLAARSANAAKETTAMIESSIKKVEDGTKIANETALALNKIVGGVTEVATLVNNIAVASNEQAAGIAQINQGIAQVSQVVQSNSATSEESAAASEELSSQAEMLKQSVSRFKLKNKSYSQQYGELNPEVLRVLEGMADKNRRQRFSDDGGASDQAVSKIKIALSDQEFGKY